MMQFGFCKFWWIRSSITCEKTIPFSSFLSFFTVFWCSTPSTAVFVSGKVMMKPIKLSDCWWPSWCRKFVSGLQRLEKLELFEMHTSLGPGAQMLFRRKRTKLDKSIFCSHFVGDFSCVVEWKEFPWPLGCVCVWKNCFCIVSETIAIGFQIWLELEWTDFFLLLWEGAFFVVILAWTTVRNNCSIVFLFWWHEVFSMISLRVFVIYYLNAPVIFSHSIFS